jgi:prepilin-type N-terminal cleavage/methylation domain-containing protein
MNRRTEDGFSLIEMLVAMVLTLLIMGSVFNFVVSAQRSFEREPQRADRQQNLRVAMDTIVRDVSAAGVEMPTFAQVFTGQLADDPEAPVAPERAARPDALEMLSNLDGRDTESLCGSTAGPVPRAWTTNAVSDAPEAGVVIVFLDDHRWTARQAGRAPFTLAADQPGESPCDPGVAHATLSFDRSIGDPAFNVYGGLCGTDGIGTAAGDPVCRPVRISTAELVRYRIRSGADGIPNLERRSSTAFTGANFEAAYEVLARGIEDLRVEYAQAGQPELFVALAPAVVLGDYQSLITQVRITLIARTTGAEAITRSTLVSTVAVRAALVGASQSPSSPPWK